MKQFFLYVQIQLKRLAALWPSILIGTMVLAAMLGTIVFCGQKLLYGESRIGKVQTAIVMEKVDTMTSLMLSVLEGMDSVKELCDFHYVKEEEASEGLQKGIYQAAILVPEKLLQGILNGRNPEVKILLPDTGGVETAILKELTEAGMRNLGTAQAGIYAIDAYLMEQGMYVSVSEAEKILNKLYLKYGMDREGYFSERTSPVGNGLSISEYYFVSAIVLLLFLTGIPCATVLKPELIAFRRKMRVNGMGDFKQLLAKQIALFCCLELLVFFIILGSFFISSVMEGIAVVSLMGAIRIVPVLAAISAYIIFCYSFMGTSLGGSMFLFFTSIAFHIAAGGFLPEVFLPSILQKINWFLPNGGILKQAAFLFPEQWNQKALLITVLWFLLFELGCYISTRRDEI